MSFYSNTNAEARPVGIDLNAVMRQVYLWLTAGLVVCAGTAYFMASTGRTLGLFNNPIISIVLLIAYFVAVFALYPVVMRSSPAVGAIFYLGVTALLGIMLSTIFLEYKLGTIAYAFGATAATFGAMSVVAPIAGVSAAVPVVVGIASGDRPGPPKLAGMACALAGVFLASREPGASGTRFAAGVG